MTQEIKNNVKIEGITMAGVKNVISQFADDTALFVKFSEENLNAVVDLLTYIENNTGLKISYEKTCIYRIGSLKNSDAKCYTTRPMKWSDGDIELLGFCIKTM